MTSLSTFAEVGALAGDPARAGMLRALMDGRALTASELAYVAGTRHRRRAATWRVWLQPVFSASRSRAGIATIVSHHRLWRR
jgi:hypothetical protein